MSMNESRSACRAVACPEAQRGFSPILQSTELGGKELESWWRDGAGLQRRGRSG